MGRVDGEECALSRIGGGGGGTCALVDKVGDMGYALRHKARGEGVPSRAK